MSDIVKVVEEEFDDEGNLVRRVTTEYGATQVRWKTPDTDTKIRVGDVWPYQGLTGQWVTSGPNDYTINNNNQFDHGSFHSHRQGGTDRDGSGVVV